MPLELENSINPIASVVPGKRAKDGLCWQDQGVKRFELSSQHLLQTSDPGSTFSRWR